jgi:hypothetical protein
MRSGWSGGSIPACARHMSVSRLAHQCSRVRSSFSKASAKAYNVMTRPCLDVVDEMLLCESTNRTNRRSFCNVPADLANDVRTETWDAMDR